VDPDLPLIEALQAGDDSALNELINRHREALHHFAFRYLRDEAAARDVAQETFVRVYFKADKFKPQSLTKTWIYSIALNLCRDHSRKYWKRRSDVSLDLPSTEQHPRLELADPADEPSARAVKTDHVALLHAAIDQLPQKLKEALVLFTLDGKSQKETADILGTSPKAVELRVHQAKLKLRDILGGVIFLKN